MSFIQELREENKLRKRIEKENKRSWKLYFQKHPERKNEAKEFLIKLKQTYE